MSINTLDYLAYLAELNTTHIHPFGSAATAVLMKNLNLQSGQRILEVGCGTGETMIMVAQHADVSVTGIDILPAMLHMAQRRLQMTKFANVAHIGQATASALPFSSQTFDRVYMESVLGFQSIADAQSMLSQIWRVLKPGGIVVANEAIWKPETTDAEAAIIYSACMRDFGIAQASEQAWDVDRWTIQMQVVGFDVLASDLLTAKWIAGYSSSVLDSDAIAFSRQMTQTQRRRRWYSPRMLLQTVRYRRLLARHQTDGRFMESRLFVLEKPVISL